MKKPIKIIIRTLLVLLIIVISYGLFTYLSDPYIKALVQNNESKLFYRPSVEIEPFNDLNFSEQILTVEDSINIHTYLFHPSTKAKANIFLVRGNSGNTSQGKELIKPLVDNGFKVYSTDWRGYGKSNGVPNYKGLMKDTEIAFADFLNRTKNDSIKTIVYGMSLGGQLAVKLTKENQTKVDALVLDGSLESAHSFITDNFRAFYLKSFTNNAEDYNQDYIAIRDIAEIENIPKLIIQSAKDRAVPFERGQNIFNAAKEPKLFWETNTDHIRTIPELTEELNFKLIELIR
ncbi:alpha/beta fold hydrolase [uncultured Maribacter sp.]|uniref:alpha/beta hydrolase n=1 Tax=uncultured Maribacter sp. TaxID=431308 RepID=UPI00261B9B7A|nr:alpha/beta fold hydrolase [uncultured Maribacter sp.]